MSVWNLITDQDLKHAIGKRNFCLIKSTLNCLKSNLCQIHIAICSFIHESPYTLDFKIGDKLEIFEECEGNLMNS